QRLGRARHETNAAADRRRPAQSRLTDTAAIAIVGPSTGEEREMVHAIRFAKTGGPEVLEWQEVDVGKPGPGQVRIRHTAVGLNYIDTYQRSGLYPMPLPSGLGSEAAGIIEEAGPGVSGLKPGDRVAYAGGPLGAYSEARVMPADRLVPDPAHPCRKARRDDPDPCRGRRCRADRLPMGEASRRHGDRDGRRRR